MSKIFSKILCFGIVIFSPLFSPLFSELKDIKNPPPDLQRIIDSKVLRVAMVKTDVPPFFFINSKGKLSGIDVELARKIAKALDVKVVFNRTTNSFDQLVVKVANGEVDVAISKLSRSGYRAKYALFSKPYALFRQAMAVNRKELAKKVPDPERIPHFIKDFKGRIGVKANTSYVRYVEKNFPKARVLQFGNWQKAVDSVLSGKILAIYRDEMEIKKINLFQPDASLKLRIVYLTDVKDNISIAVSWQSRQLLDWLNLFLENNGILYSSQEILDEYAEELNILNKKNLSKKR